MSVTELTGAAIKSSGVAITPARPSSHRDPDQPLVRSGRRIVSTEDELNRVGPWFGPTTEKVVRYRSTESVHQVTERIRVFVECRDDGDRMPFRRTTTVDSILAKLERPSRSIPRTSCY